MVINGLCSIVAHIGIGYSCIAMGAVSVRVPVTVSLAHRHRHADDYASMRWVARLFNPFPPLIVYRTAVRIVYD